MTASHLKSCLKARFKLPLFTAFGCLLFGFASAQSPALTESNAPPQTVLQGSAENTVVLPSGFNDPIEPFNRAMWGFNKGFMSSVVRPFSKGYRFVVAQPVRTGIGNMGKNWTYPGRLVNNLLQGNWTGMGEETGRCLCNTVLGLGGFFDLATKWGIPKSDAKFGQTLQKWGWNPGFFIMLPILGPSDDRDAAGLIGDAADEPQSYFFPYDLGSPSAMANNFSDTVEASVIFSKSQADSYSILEYAWSFANENRKVDMRLIGNQDEPSLETLQAVFCTCQDPDRLFVLILLLIVILIGMRLGLR
jgi:ABC-type transporter lipoprotein component MlaA